MNKKNDTIAGWLFLAPALIIFAILVVFPIIMSLLLSFTEWNFLSGFEGIEWKGLANFERLFTRDRKFMMALKNTVFYAFTTAPISIVIGLLFAFMLNDKVYLRKLNRMFFFIPYICSMVALAAVFRFLFRVDGPINAIFARTLGMDPIPWLNKTAYNKIPVVCVMIYAAVGYNLIVYMAALQNVPRELYEAATVEGAGPFMRFIKVTVPLMSPTTSNGRIIRWSGRMIRFRSGVFTETLCLSRLSARWASCWWRRWRAIRWARSASRDAIWCSSSCSSR